MPSPLDHARQALVDVRATTKELRKAYLASYEQEAGLLAEVTRLEKSERAERPALPEQTKKSSLSPQRVLFGTPAVHRQAIIALVKAGIGDPSLLTRVNTLSNADLEIWSTRLLRRAELRSRQEKV